ncbi:MAG: hypothetical protein RL026_1587 [Pseudomonadota bacterium]|jgi:glycolate oxidase FAD binding subunit
MDEMLREWSARIQAAAAAQRPLCLQGGGSKAFYGHAPRGEPMALGAWQGIEAYEPDELVVTVRSGTPLAVLESALAERGQMLAFEPPHFGPGSTVGGCVAAGLAGPRRMAGAFPAGAVRDHVLGVKLLDGQGRLLRFGGTVMKNVAGYDVSRMLAGSLGILGILVELSLKVLPRPACRHTLRFALDETSALQCCNEWASRPLPVSASAWADGVLHLRLEGSDAAVEAASRQLGGDDLSLTEADTFWSGLRDQSTGFFRGDEEPLWRFSLPPTAKALSLPGRTCIEWGGAQRWVFSSRPDADLRALASRLGGHATRWRGGDRAQGVFTPLPAPLRDIHQRLKQQLDPSGIFNPGRLVEGL